MLEKVRKLLAMGRDGRGNAHEQETAMRQANKLMAEFGIAEAECDMSAIDAGEMIFGEVKCGPDGKPLKEGKVFRMVPLWVSVLSVGVARFTDTVTARKTTANGETIVFRGEQQDVLLARWVFATLIEAIQHEQKCSGWTSRADANRFRVAAASTLQVRCKALHKEREELYRKAQSESGSRALMVVDRKALEIAKRFGEQRTGRAKLSSSGDHGAGIAGREAGQRINIPSGRPIGNDTDMRRLT